MLRKKVETEVVPKEDTEPTKLVVVRSPRQERSRRKERRRQPQTQVEIHKSGGGKGFFGLLFGSAIGAAATYFFDPDRGRSRRVQAKDQARAAARSASDQAGRKARKATSDAKGKVEAWKGAERGYEPPNDETLKAKVESELFAHPDVPKGDVLVTVRDAVVELRGQVASRDLADQIEQYTRDIAGVSGVENLLHLPGEEAPAPEPTRVEG